MKKINTIIAAFFVCVGLTYAGSLKENCGCGLGTTIFESSGEGKLIHQTLAITTNGIYGMNLFSVTTGTFGCKQFDKIVKKDQMKIFVAGNMDGLAKDIAMGEGEVLSALADIMEVPQDKTSGLLSSPAFSKTLTPFTVTMLSPTTMLLIIS